MIADSGANPDFVASDLLSQAEHGPDSQVILLTPDADMGSRVAEAVERQLAALPRAETARVALSASRIIVARDLAQCVAISNLYGPEHLIIQTRQARELVDSITSAGSVFWRLVTGIRGRLRLGQPRPADLWLHRHLLKPRPGRLPEADDRAGAVARRLCRPRLND